MKNIDRYLCFDDTGIDNVYFSALSDAVKFCKEYSCACVDVECNRIICDYREYER